MHDPTARTVSHSPSRLPRPDDSHEIALGNQLHAFTPSTTALDTTNIASDVLCDPSPMHMPTLPSVSSGASTDCDWTQGSESPDDMSVSAGHCSQNSCRPLVTNSFRPYAPETSSVPETFNQPLLLVPRMSVTEDLALDHPTCIGRGLDAPALGVLSTLVLPTVIGLLIWLLFSILRPRYRQVYGLREWFAPPALRPPPLGRSLWAFLFPEVPLTPSLHEDTFITGKTVAQEPGLFPSDEELSQRTLWTIVLIVSGWSFVGIGGLLPLYMASVPCLASSIPPFEYSGSYSTLQDLSLLRILQLVPDGTTSSGAVNLTSHSVQDFFSAPSHVEIRLIILVIFAVVLGLLPALWYVIRQFNQLVASRERWLLFRCEGLEMGWLSARQAPGIVGWGEKRLKDFLVKTGLSSTMEIKDVSNGEGNENEQSRRQRRRAQTWSEEEKARLEIDIQSLFSIGDTNQLAILIYERDEILENLEIAETKYINSFRLTTPVPSVADMHLSTIAEDPDAPTKPAISRPLPLSSKNSRRRRGRNPAFGSSSLPPTSFVMPSPYYKLRNVSGLSGGHFADVDRDIASSRREPSLSDSFNQRVVGSRFQEVNGSSPSLSQIPMGSQVAVNRAGHLEAVRSSESPDTARWVPGAHASWATAETSPYINHLWNPHGSQDPILAVSDEDWHDVLSEDPEAFQNAEEYPADSRRRPRPPRPRNGIEADRESFPLRTRTAPNPDEAELPPPHLRLQLRQPYVRPNSDVSNDALSAIYADISLWRSKLKAINAEIAQVQSECYNDIADGARIKGWLLIGRGLRFIPGIELIEGRAKEDIRWDELQNEGGFHRTLSFWIVAVTISLLLGIGLTAVAGLFLSNAPDYAHYFPFLGVLNEGNELGAGIATCLAAALAAILFISIAITIIHYSGQLVYSVSLSGGQLFIFKAIFYVLVAIPGAWLFAVGAVLFAMHSFSIDIGASSSVADGIIYMSVFALLLILAISVVFPGLLLLQPVRLLRILRTEKQYVTSRQRFRVVYPRTYNPSYALSGCVLAFAYASAFTFLFPLVAPAALLLLLLTLIAHRFLVGYVYGRTHSSTGGLLQIWLLRRLGTLLTLQPLILGLVLLSRNLWIMGGILCGFALFVVVFVECYCSWHTKQPGRKSLNPITLDSLETFTRTARPGRTKGGDEESLSLVSSVRNTRLRGSFASILDMMSLTLAVAPSPSETRGPVPLATETLDDLTATERAARTNPEAPPHLPPLSFADHAEEMAGILYAPELLAPSPMIWLPNDTGGIGRSEAYDLQRYHGFHVTLDVGKEDIPLRHPSQSRRGQVIR